MKENKYITESVASIRNLMGRIGENLIKEDAVQSTKTKIECKNPIEVSVESRNEETGSKMVYVNFNINEINENFGPNAVNALRNICQKKVAQTGINFKNNILVSKGKNSGDTILSVRLYAMTNENFIEKNKTVTETVYNIMSKISNNNINRTFDDVWSEVETMASFEQLNVKSDGITAKLHNVILRASAMWKKLLEENPDTDEDNIKIYDDGVEINSKILDPREKFGHQLSLLNRCLIVSQAQAYNVPCPKFVCTHNMLTNAFQRKFKTGIDIHPYYIRFVGEKQASLKGILASLNADAKDLVKNNPQIAKKLAIDYGSHNANYFGWCEYYDIEETEPIDPNNDIFQNTIGMSDNLMGIANDKAQSVFDKMNQAETPDTTNDIETSEEPQEVEAPKFNDVFTVRDVMKKVCDKFNYSEAYSNLGYKDEANDERVAREQLRNITNNLCRHLIAYHNISKKSLVDGYASQATAMVLRMLNVEKSGFYDKDNINNAVRNVVDEIRSKVQEIYNEESSELVSESLLGYCLHKALNGNRIK